MSGFLTVGGAFNGQNGILSVPSALSSPVNTLLQTYLNGVTASVTGGTASFTNIDITAGTVFGIGVGVAPHFTEITNVDANGASTNGAAAGVATVGAGTTDLFVQVPGNVTVDGVASTSVAIFGGNSNVTYNVGGGTGSIFAAGGADSLNATGSGSSYNVTSAGNDTLNFNGTNGVETVTATGNATTSVFLGGGDVATVTATGNSKVSVVFHTNAGGNLDFVNNSSQAQTIFSGSYTTGGGQNVFAPNSITVFGGQGGGFYVGGRGGFNSINGGSGSSTLVGGGQGDTLIAGGANNQLFAGAGGETLMGGGTVNGFYLGLEEPGIGSIQAVGGLASAGGSGTQTFLLGNVDGTTLTGSTVSGSQNVFDVLGSYTTTGGEALTFGGSSFTINDFSGNDTINLLKSVSNGAGGPSVESVQAGLAGGTQILLSDNTVITLSNVTTSQVSVNGAHNVITFV
ncbi:hypothetical protein [Acidocella sp. MX-AZ02]|uniref:beta strand repeat-containing protein n=1 Tax=Acidocella sp. MX-AZ02 TaxID=1214225 RepID=UPI001181ADFD|nr:hypothetical protein [Acidocella sp. MX-AZ02]